MGGKERGEGREEGEVMCKRQQQRQRQRQSLWKSFTAWQ